MKIREVSVAILLLTLVVLTGIPLVTPACAGFTSAPDLGAAVLDCAKQGVQSKVGSIVGTVLDLSRKGGDGWESKLLALGLDYGEDVLRCALRAAQAELSGTRAIGDAAALERIRAFETKKGWQP